MELSERSLRRNLAEEKTRFRHVLDDVNMKLAINYLKNTTLNISEIASLTGYSHSSGFRSAFKRLMGTPPGEIRKSHLIR